MREGDEATLNEITSSLGPNYVVTDDPNAYTLALRGEDVVIPAESIVAAAAANSNKAPHPAAAAAEHETDSEYEVVYEEVEVEGEADNGEDLIVVEVEDSNGVVSHVQVASLPMKQQQAPKGECV